MRRLVAFVSLTLTIFVAACSGNESTAPSTQNDPVVAPKGVVPPSFATASNGEGLSITTDKDDYMPGDTVWFTGAGWQPGDTLDIVLTDDPQTHEPHTWWVPVNETGGFRDSTYIVDTGDLGVMFTLVATSRANPQQTLTVQFTDGRDIQSVTLNNAAATTVAPGGLINANVKGQLTGNSNNTLGSIGVKAHVDGTAASTAVQLTCFNVNPDMGPSVPPNQIPYDQSFSFNAPNPATQPTTYDVIVTSYADNACTTTQGAASFSVNDGIVVQVANQPANQPTGLAQFKANGTTSIATGGATNETSVVLKGTVSDPNAANTVKLQVEVKPVGTVFTNTASAESGLVTNGTVASATVAGLSNNTNYHWQARAVDNNGLASDWVSFGDNPEADTDFRVDLTRPSVAINQAATQVDPTGASPIKFTAVFNEDVTGFATGDVTLTGGSAPGTLVGAVSGGPKEYEIAVTGMTGDGTVIASIAEGVATDLAGNTNLASTSTDNSVLYDKTPPVISSLLLTPSLTNGSGSHERGRRDVR